ncbi:type IV pilin protein, partial [Vibrio cholerae]
MKNNKGFTLIELMTTVAIIGILMLMAFPSYDSYVKRVKIVQELVLLQPVINMQKMEMAMGLPEVGQRSDFLQSMRDQQDKSGENGWLIG